MWPLIIAAGSTLLDMYSKKKAGEKEAAAGAEDLTDAALSGHFREKGVSEKRSRTLGTMRARTAASGVDMSGSSLQVLMNSASQAARDLYIARHIAGRNMDSATDRIDKGNAAQTSAVTSGLIGLGKVVITGAKDASARYKPPIQGESWMKEYGND
jgi:hypothetical protein